MKTFLISGDDGLLHYTTSTSETPLITELLPAETTTPKELTTESFTKTTQHILDIIQEKVTESAVKKTQPSSVETIIESAKPEAEPPFPPFPDIYDQSYLAPQVTRTTSRPTTTADIILRPGSCLFDGKVYVSAQQIPRDNPCDFCFCFRGDIICLQQSCPPPIPGCFEEAIAGFCCPRYECPVRTAVMNITTTTPSPFPGFPPTSKVSRVNMCEIEGKYYAAGERVEEASSPCLDCL